MNSSAYRSNGEGKSERERWGERAAVALARAGEIWRERLESGWEPPEGSAFPWAQVRLSLAALVSGLEKAGEWRLLALTPLPPLSQAKEGESETAALVSNDTSVSSAAATVNSTNSPSFACERGGRGVRAGSVEGRGTRAALILAGNTPLMSWSPLAASLLAGCQIDVKMSRGETLWPRLCVDALAEADPDVAARVSLHEWPGDDPRTLALVRDADVVIAFGSDATFAALRAATPQETPFFGYGHAVSAGLWRMRSTIKASPDFNDYLTAVAPQASGFAADVMTYGQSGCLSPQTIFVEGGADYVPAAVDLLEDALPSAADKLDVRAAADAEMARSVREERDLASFGGARVVGDPALRWTLVVWPEERAMPLAAAPGLVHLVPILDVARLPEQFDTLRGRVSSVGVAGAVAPELRASLKANGVSRICPPGEMQTPPLDWPNGGFDLLTELLRIEPRGR